LPSAPPSPDQPDPLAVQQSEEALLHPPTPAVSSPPLLSKPAQLSEQPAEATLLRAPAGPPPPPPWSTAFSTDPDRIICRKCCRRSICLPLVFSLLHVSYGRNKNLTGMYVWMNSCMKERVHVI
jgi:hypothetical protein